MSPADRFVAPPEAAGERLDRYLAGRYGVARNRVAGWLRDGRVEVGGAVAKASLRLAGGEAIACRPRPIEQSPEMVPDETPIRVLFESAAFAVLDKPAGLVMHPGAGRRQGTLAHRLLARYPETAAVGGPGRPGIVHRLDRETSGLVAVARTPEAYGALGAAFAERRVDKRYLGVVYGDPGPDWGRIEMPIGRHPQRRKEMAPRPRGRPAATAHRRLAAAGGLSLVELRLETGRTHQARVHLKAAGWPLVGDPVYGEARWKGLRGAARIAARSFPRQALHAWRLAFADPEDGRWRRFEAPLPADMADLWERASGAPVPELAAPDPAPSED